MKIEFVDLKAQYLSIKAEIDWVVADVIEKSSFVRGHYVEKFEDQFAIEMHRKFCVSCANGTDALYIAMTALALKPGDEVIVPAHSWISSSETVTQAGGKVVFCDTDGETFTIDPKLIETKITSRTVGIIPVHLYGQSADMNPIMEIARKHNLWVLEDCAQAHLAKYKGSQIGTFGDAATFSFYPGKNLGAMGDAGAIITNNSELAQKMAMFARHGGLKKGDHQIEGVNSRMDGLQAAILSVKLPYLKEWTRLRQSRASLYSEKLSSLDAILCPKVALAREHVWHLYVIKSEERERLREYLSEKGIPSVINYPTALPFLPAYKRFGNQPEDFPNAFSDQSRILSLPIFPELKDEEITFISKAIHDFTLQK